MCKAKNMVLLTLAAAAFAVCAMLPGMVSSYRDDRVLEQIQFGESPDVALEIRESVIPSPLTAMAMLGRMDGSITVADTMASMTCEAAEKAALAAMGRYMDAGLLESFEIDSVEVCCMLGNVLEDPALSGIYWSVTILGHPDSPFCMAHIAIDDATGRPILVNCSRANPLDYYHRDHLLPVFAQIYFQDLGMEDYGAHATDDLANQYIGENNRAQRYRFDDPAYGEVYVDLYVHEFGFYTEFPVLTEVRE